MMVINVFVKTSCITAKAMFIKTLLNKIERFKSFIYDDTRFQTVKGLEALVIELKLVVTVSPPRRTGGAAGLRRAAVGLGAATSRQTDPYKKHPGRHHRPGLHHAVG